jgi:hypothetical protein
VLTKVGGMLVERTVTLLSGCIERGFQRTMEQFIEGSSFEALEQKASDAKTAVALIGDDLLAEPRALVAQVLGPFQGQIDALKENARLIGEIASAVQTLAHAIRVGLCLAGGVESVGISCVLAVADLALSLFGLSPIDYIAGKLMDSCQAQRLMAEAMLKLRVITDIPVTLATLIIDQTRSLLPEPIKGLLCDPAEIAGQVEMPTPDDIECGEGTVFDEVSDEVGDETGADAAPAADEGAEPGEKRAEGGGAPDDGGSGTVAEGSAAEEPRPGGVAAPAGDRGTQTVTHGTAFGDGTQVATSYIITSALDLPADIGKGVDRVVSMDIRSQGDNFAADNLAIRVTGRTTREGTGERVVIFHFTELVEIKTTFADGSWVVFSPVYVTAKPPKSTSNAATY